VALFSVVASVPTLLVVIFASLLFQYGVDFWFSNRVRVVLENSDRVAQAYVDEHRDRIASDITASRVDFRLALSQVPLDDPRMRLFFGEQLALRGLGEIALIQVSREGTHHFLGGALADTRSLQARLPAPALPDLSLGKPFVSFAAGDRVEADIMLDPLSRTYCTRRAM
jgi:two-component system nitrogen regulation sensor histidine kinase NtrY